MSMNSRNTIIAPHVDGLVQGYSNSIANAMELLQSCTKLSIMMDQLTGGQSSLRATAVGGLV